LAGAIQIRPNENEITNVTVQHVLQRRLIAEVGVRTQHPRSR
jgi:hypothetical protein